MTPLNVEALERLADKVACGGPHEWGFRDPTDGTFIADNWPFEIAAVLPQLLAAVREGERYRALLERVTEASERVIGEHSAPDDCYATGPLTGNPIADLVVCPACVAIAENALARQALHPTPREGV